VLTSIEGIYENGVVHLLEPLPNVGRSRVVVTVLPATLSALPVPEPQLLTQTGVQPLTGDDVVDHFEPKTDLGRKLIALRRAYVQGGGKLQSLDEINAEVRERRGGVADD